MNAAATPGGPDRADGPDSTEEPDGLDVFDAPPAIPGLPAAEAPTLAYAETPPETARIAHPVLRAFAFFLDGFTTFVVVVVVVIVGLSIGNMDPFWAIPVVPLAAAVLATVLTALRGVTPAKAVLGLRVVDADSGVPIGFGRASLRSLVVVAPIIISVGATLLLSRLPSETQSGFGDGLFTMVVALPFAGWVALLVVLAVRPRHRGLQDLAGRSVVVRR